MGEGYKCRTRIPDFTIDNYPNLKKLTIGYNDLHELNEFTVSNCPKLEEIEVGNNAVRSTSKFTASFISTNYSNYSKIDLPVLKTITTGMSSFYNANTVVIESTIFLLIIMIQ